MVNVIDKDEQEAKNALKAIGITNINIAYEENSSKTPGKVIKQSIEGGSSVEKDASITITVNSYVENKTVSLSINVKKITGYTESSANTNTNGTVSQTTKTPKKITVKTYVDGVVKDTSTANENDENLKVNVSATAQVHDIKIEAGDALKTRTVNFATESSVTIE